jgi:hypothetical protein
MRPCAVLFHVDFGYIPKDTQGCRLPDGHQGPHEFVDERGEVWQWETDWECDCDHCNQCEGDYCMLYWSLRERQQQDARNLGRADEPR